jgi:hypothetical protein
MDLMAGNVKQSCVYAALDAIATLCAANGGSYKITIPAHIKDDAGEVVVTAHTANTIEFAYRPQGMSYQ